MRKCVVVAALLMVLVGTQAGAQCPPTELILSEYVEGSSNNKAIEIFNGTSGAIDLASSDYELWIYFNGSTSPSSQINLTGSVPADGTFVLCDNDADAGLLAVCDLEITSSLFNGDDTVVLIKYATKKGATQTDAVVDSLGQIGFDPGSGWGAGDVYTANKTLRRKESVCNGDTDTSDVFDPTVEWEGFAQDTFDGLGSHTVLPVELMSFSVE